MVNVTPQTLGLSLLSAAARTDGRTATASLVSLGEVPVERDVAKLRAARDLLDARTESEFDAKMASARPRPEAPTNGSPAEIARLKEKVAGYSKALGRLMAARPAPEGAAYATMVVGVHSASGGASITIQGQDILSVYTRLDVIGRTRQEDPAVADAVSLRARIMHGVDTAGGNDALTIEAGEVVGVQAGNDSDSVVIVAQHVRGVYTDHTDRSFGQPEIRPGQDAVAISANFVEGVSTGAGNDAVVLRGDVVRGVDAGEGQDAISITAGLVERVHGGDGNDTVVVDAELGGYVVDMMRYREREGMAGADDPVRALGEGGYLPPDVDGGYGNDAISLRVGTALMAKGGRGDDAFAISGGGTVGLVYGTGDGHDTVTLGAGTGAVLNLWDLEGPITVEHGEDSVTVRMSAGGSVTFRGLADAGPVAMMVPGSSSEPVILSAGRQTILDRRV